MRIRSFLSPLSLPRLGNGPELLQRPEQVELGPLFHQLAPLKAIYLYAAHLDLAFSCECGKTLTLADTLPEDWTLFKSYQKEQAQSFENRSSQPASTL